MGYEFLDHTADIQVHSWGKNLEEAFEQATLGLMDLMVDTKDISPEISKEITLSAPDKEILLVDYLSEYLSIFDIDELLFSKIKVDKIEFNENENKFTVHAIAYGEKYNPDKLKGIFDYTFTVQRINKKLGSVGQIIDLLNL